jgi:hypothetical protein
MLPEAAPPRIQLPGFLFENTMRRVCVPGALASYLTSVKQQSFTQSNAILRLSLPLALCLAQVVTAAGPTGNAIKIDSVADIYAMQDYSFEVNQKTGLAGIRLEYTYPPARVGGDDIHRGPDPKVVTLPGLTYDAAARAVVYDDGVGRITCATAAHHRLVLFNGAYMKPTGACIVTSRLTRHERDNGWNIDRSGTLDAYFDVRRK